MTNFSTEWGVLSPWGCNAVDDRHQAESIVRNMRDAGHAASVVWRGVTQWHNEINDELAMQSAETKES